MDTPLREIEKLKKTILDEYPRLSETSRFKFKCHPGVACFNDCCGDVNIFLTPYDIIRLKKNLGISSEDFLSKYTLSPFDEKLKYPIVLLKMEDDEKKSCPFVGPEGCRVYPDRPWSCRMYPLGLASPKGDDETGNKEFYFLLQETTCRGFGENHEQSIADWIKNQGIEEYNKQGDFFKELTLHEKLQRQPLPPEKIEMFFTACYNLDTFRRFIFGSSFLQKFEVEPQIQQKIKDDDVDLMKFAFNWLRFSLFGEKTMQVKGEVLSQKKAELKSQGKLKEDK